MRGLKTYMYIMTIFGHTCRKPGRPRVVKGCIEKKGPIISM